MVLENRVVDGLDHAALLGGVGELDVVLLEFVAKQQAARILDFLVGKFLTPGLNREVGLAEGDDFLGGVGVLDDEVACIPRHEHGLGRAHGSLADLDHVGDFNEMIVHPLAAVETGRAGFFHDGFKVAVVAVAEHTGEIAAGPILVARVVGAADLLKRGRRAGGEFVGHGWGV